MFSLLAKLNTSAEHRHVQAAQQRDKHAFDQLVEMYERPLRGYLERRIAPDMVDDVLQETWVAAWNALPRFGGRSPFKTWLYGIAAHKCIDHQRSRQTQSIAGFSDLLENIEAPQSRPSNDLAESIGAIIAQLPNSQQEVLELYYYAELTLPEISKALGRNLNTVKYQFYRAHARVAAALQERPSEGIVEDESAPILGVSRR